MEDLSAEELVGFLLYGTNTHSGSNEFVTSWQQQSLSERSRAVSWRDRAAAHLGWPDAPGGPWTLILLALCLAGPWLLTGRARAGMILFATTALALLLFPILVKAYDYRFVIPGYAPLVAAAALSAWGVAVKVRSKLPAHPRGDVAEAG